MATGCPGNPSWVPGVEVAGGEAVKKGRAPGKEKVVLEVDCKAVHDPS